MNQKIVIKLQMEDDKKRAKVMKKAVGAAGVQSAAIEGADKNQIVVVGEGVDSVTLVTSLRKLMGFAELVSVAKVEEKKPDEKKTVENKQDDKKTEPTAQMISVCPHYAPPGFCYCYLPPEMVCQYPEPAGCSIM